MDNQEDNATRKKPNVFLNVFCFLLPFPVTFFLPAGISILAALALDRFIYDHAIVLAIPITYIVFIALEIALFIKLVKIASSPRSKAAAQSLLYGANSIIPIFVMLFLLSIAFR